MSSAPLSAPSLATMTPKIECSSCQNKLPLRLSQDGDAASLWLCANCRTPYVACCIAEAFPSDTGLVRYAERYFDVDKLPPLEPEQLRLASQMSQRASAKIDPNLRRSERFSQSLIVPAVLLNNQFAPEETAFRLPVANLSREGVGFVHPGKLDSEFLAMELSPQSACPIQLIVKIVRHVRLADNYYEVGGRLLARMGNFPVR